MSREFKQTFFTCLLVVLLVISNLIGLKLTNFLDLTITVSFITYPFTYLCTLLILNMGGKNAAYRAIIIATLIQVFITISYTLAVSLGSQGNIPDMALAVNQVFKVNESNILASLVAFLTSHYALIYIYDSFKSYKKELFGVAFGLLGALFLNTIIYNISVLYEQSDFIYIINTLLSNIIISLVMIVIMIILFFILKEKDLETVKIKDMNITVNNYKTDDLAIEDIITEKKTEVKKNSNNYHKKTSPSKKTRTNNYQGTKKGTTKKSTTTKKKSSTNKVKNKDK